MKKVTRSISLDSNRLISLTHSIDELLIQLLSETETNPEQVSDDSI